VPDVPEAALAKNAPPTVAELVMLYEALLAEFVTTEGLAVVAAANVAAGRLPE
jgi:hypothetical protein